MKVVSERVRVRKHMEDIHFVAMRRLSYLIMKPFAIGTVYLYAKKNRSKKAKNFLLLLLKIEMDYEPTNDI
jgi:hypothetical protein